MLPKRLVYRTLHADRIHSIQNCLTLCKHLKQTGKQSKIAVISVNHYPVINHHPMSKSRRILTITFKSSNVKTVTSRRSAGTELVLNLSIVWHGGGQEWGASNLECKIDGSPPPRGKQGPPPEKFKVLRQKRNTTCIPQTCKARSIFLTHEINLVKQLPRNCSCYSKSCRLRLEGFITI